MVVDDAHLLPAASVRALNDRLGAEPDRLRVALLTRWDLGLSRLVPELLGHLTVLRGDVLRLSHDETARLVAQHARSDVPELVEAIIETADGWCAAVVMTARAAAAAPSVAAFVRRCRTSGPGVADLIAGEVFVSLRPRERHLLLCAAGEPLLTVNGAVHLTRDPGAGDVLESLELTGLLVNRVTDRPAEPGAPGTVQYRIHPLLREVVRRRLASGGVDVRQAHATTSRAARLDLARGETTAGVRRLLALGEHDEVAHVLAAEGPALVSSGLREQVIGLARWAGGTVERHPEMWTTLAWAYWSRGDAESAEHWGQRIVRLAGREPAVIPGSHVMCVRLHRSRSGVEPVGEAVAAARAFLDRERPSLGHDPFRALLLLELGAAENWLGELVEAERHLSEAVLLSRGHGLPGPTMEALSHLALTQYMTGREGAACELARRVLVTDASECAQDPLSTSRRRAELVRDLVDVHTSPAGQPASELSAGHPDDHAGRFWRRVLEARCCVLSGAVADAQRRLDHPFDVPPPPHLRVVLLVERAMVGLVSGNRALVGQAAVELSEIPALDEARWVRGALADVDGDLATAAGLYTQAAAGTHHGQPTTRPLSLVCAAQLTDYLGDHEAAAQLLAEAVTLTASRACVLPFLGWSTHGTRVGQLLTAHPPTEASSWAGTLQSACAEQVSIVARFRPLVATPHERDGALPPTMAPVLSPREHEVLIELARGSTYADIASNLFLSQNTVKTHISSLYAKLAVGRRSEALAVARTLHLV